MVSIGVATGAVNGPRATINRDIIIIITFFFIRPLTHDGMAKEDAEFRAYLEENGYDTSMMGLGDDESTGSFEEESVKAYAGGPDVTEKVHAV